MAGQRQTRHIGDTRVAIAATLQRPDGTAVNLTGLTVKFKMVDDQGNTKVAETTDNVTIVSATAGTVKYSPVAADVDTAGSYYAYFTVYSGTSGEHFPVKKADLIIDIEANY